MFNISGALTTAAPSLSLCTCSDALDSIITQQDIPGRVHRRRRLNERLAVRDCQAVKSLPTLIAICLAVCGGDAIGDCPAGYPEGFPRIDGGTFISVPSQAGQPVIPNAFYVLRYDQTASALFGSVLNEASNAAWIVVTQSEAQEPGGPRYRALLRKAEQAISISVVSKPEGSYLLVVKRLSK